ncbi:CotH kinase family protein [Bacillus sp. CGMCC 1.16541]|uniref:CotH kinase family protein n=1 Tax=Bacillus sp. CGMCC 1.16541 TaxID=2185143 RepID=UPI000D72B88F|nr:CotH kinase family protein [Bacillus sp. CGMCC 1.16541]
MMDCYQFFIRPNDIKELKKDIWCDEPIPAQLLVQNQKIEIDIVYRGATTRTLKKKSYFVRFYNPKKLGGEKEFHLNAEYLDPSFMRNKLSLDFFHDIGILAPQAHYVEMKMNGKREGVYLKIESVNEDFLKKRNVPTGSLFYAIDADANFSLMSELTQSLKESLEKGYESKYLYGNDQQALVELIYNVNTLSHDEFAKKIPEVIHVENYLRWLTGVVCTQNYDGFVQNYALYRNSQTGLFELIPWDCDGTWGRNLNGNEMQADYLRIQGFNTLSARLLHLPIFKAQYRDILAEVLEKQFTVEYMGPKIMSLYNMLYSYVESDPYISKYSEQFKKEPAFILNFIDKRRAFLYKQLDELK